MAFLQVLVLFSTLLFGWAFEVPVMAPLEKRQDIQPGTPLYNCHASCGYAIEISQTPHYCSNSTFTSDLSSCLECALTYNVWQYYGNPVSAAASACSDDATPSPSSATAGAPATGTASASSRAVSVSSTAAPTSSSAAVQASSGQANTTATASGTSSTSGAESSQRIDNKWTLLSAVGVLGIFQAFI